MSAPSTLNLEQQLKQLYLTSILRQYRTDAQGTTQDGWPYEAYLAGLLQQEVDRRLRNRRQRRIKDARFPLRKELVDFEFAAIPQLNQQKVMELAQGDYLDQAESVLMVGSPGLGKTHIAVALGVKAVEAGYSVHFLTLETLMTRLVKAQNENRLEQALKKLVYPKLLIIDEIGYLPLTRE